MAKKKIKTTEPYQVLADKKQLEKAKSLVNLPEAFRALLAKICHESLCPTCGASLKKKKA